ncbi:DsbA family protein [Paenibacillus algorifonticola]|uniref:DsbA family protein n=1 Tax=Paenibacillus algorifonticola TaxID=684063 RepID=UPI003D282D3E
MKKKNVKSRTLVWYTLVIVVVFIALFAINEISKSRTGIEQETAEAPPISSQPTWGDKATKVSIVEFGDYKCPSCKAWSSQIWPQLKKDYVDTKQASFSYVNVLFHGAESALGALAGEAVLESNPDDFWHFHEALFAEQPDADHDGLWITVEKLMQVAEASIPDLDKDQFKALLSSEEVQGRVDQDQQLVKDFNILQTPTIMINNKRIGNPFDYEAIQAVIEQELSEAATE